MSPAALNRQLCEASADLKKAGIHIEKCLKAVLEQSDKCSPQISLAVADSLTKLTRDIGAAPIIYLEKAQCSGDELRHIIEVLVLVLKKAEPFKATNEAELQASLAIVHSAADKYNLSWGAHLLFDLLVREIAGVFLELRILLKQQGTKAAKVLWRCTQRYIRAVRHALLVFTYSCLKLRVCLRYFAQCDPSAVTSETADCLSQNIYALIRQTRTMAAVSAFHNDTVKDVIRMHTQL